MENIKDLVNELYTVNMKIKQVVKASNYEEYDDLSGLKYDSSNPDDAFLVTELRGILDKLNDASRNIDYITRPVKGVYTLHKNRNGRYECSAREFTSGYGIEFYHYNDFYERYEWAASRVEHNGNDYYIVGYPGVSLDGLKIRLREV